MKVSSVSPLRWLTITPHPDAFDKLALQKYAYKLQQYYHGTNWRHHAKKNFWKVTRKWNVDNSGQCFLSYRDKTYWLTMTSLFLWHFLQVSHYMLTNKEWNTPKALKQSVLQRDYLFCKIISQQNVVQHWISGFQQNLEKQYPNYIISKGSGYVFVILIRLNPLRASVALI